MSSPARPIDAARGGGVWVPARALKRRAEAREAEEAREAAAPPLPHGPSAKRRRNIDLLMEQMEQGVETKRVAAPSPYVTARWHCGADDATATQLLLRELSPHGPIASARPVGRGDDGTVTVRVRFLDAADAEAAAGGGSIFIRGAAVDVVPDAGGGDGAHGGAASHGVLFTIAAHCDRALAVVDRGAVVEVTADGMGGEELRVIDAAAAAVARHGEAFEAALRAREAGSAAYAFLHPLPIPRRDDSAAPPEQYQQHVWYKWRVFSLLSGDTLETYRTAPFQMVVGGPLWQPPQALPARPALTAEERAAWFGILRQLSSERVRIEAAMVWALDRCAKAEGVVDVLRDALTLHETPLPLKRARLHLLSDILYNARHPWAAGVRDAIAAALPDVCAHLRGVPALAGDVASLLQLWSTWRVLPQALFGVLRQRAGLC